MVCFCLIKKSEEEAKKPKLSLEEKNQKKLKAIEACRIDGNRLFKEAKYDLAFQVYDRV